MENGHEAADAVPIERNTVMLDIFQRLAVSGHMGKASMRRWADLTGWDKSDVTWEKEWQILCEDLKVSPTEGFNAATFIKFVDDKKDGGCFTTDDELREIHKTLCGNRESSVSSSCALHTKGAPDSAEHTGTSESQAKKGKKKRIKGKYLTSKDDPDLDDWGWSKTKSCVMSCGRPAAGGYDTCCPLCSETHTAKHGPKCDHMWSFQESPKQEAEASAPTGSHSDYRDWGSYRAQENSYEGTDASAATCVTSMRRDQGSWDQYPWRSDPEDRSTETYSSEYWGWFDPQVCRKETYSSDSWGWWPDAQNRWRSDPQVWSTETYTSDSWGWWPDESDIRF